jgi:hypothetical protein
MKILCPSGSRMLFHRKIISIEAGDAMMKERWFSISQLQQNLFAQERELADVVSTY